MSWRFPLITTERQRMSLVLSSFDFIKTISTRDRECVRVCECKYEESDTINRQILINVTFLWWPMSWNFALKPRNDERESRMRRERIENKWEKSLSWVSGREAVRESEKQVIWPWLELSYVNRSLFVWSICISLRHVLGSVDPRLLQVVQLYWLLPGSGFELAGSCSYMV